MHTTFTQTLSARLPMILPLVLALGLFGPAQAAEPSANQSKQQATDKAASASSKAAKGKAQQSRGLFWEIQSGNKTVYMFGSIHIAKPDFYPLPKQVQAAYKKAAVLAVEVDASAPGVQEKVMPYMTYAAPDKLQNHLTPQTWKALSDTIGPNVEAMQQLKPVIVATALSIGVMQQLGYDAQSGIDMHFLKQAKADKKTIQEFESAEFQGQVLASLNDAEGDAVLAQALVSLKNGEMKQQLDDMVSAWRSGDAEKLANLLREASSKDIGSEKMMKKLFDERNIGMAEKVVQLLESGKPAFIVLGAGHMAGPNSIVDLLQKKGIKIKQIK
ncbi:MAG: hypothetical protein RL748_259 [Pseudomonadota bacterium]|jgi:uncharacterized protein YbaP (TraB family)